MSGNRILRVESFSEKRAGQPLHSLYLLYHELRTSGSEYSYVCETAIFERHMDLFVQLRKAESPGLWPEVTFDDGHISNVEYALPILQSRGLTARFSSLWDGRERNRGTWDGVSCGRCMSSVS